MVFKKKKKKVEPLLLQLCDCIMVKNMRYIFKKNLKKEFGYLEVKKRNFVESLLIYEISFTNGRLKFGKKSQNYWKRKKYQTAIKKGQIKKNIAINSSYK